MLGRDICGCLYLVAGDAAFCVSSCEGERDDAWFFAEGWRANSKFDRGEARKLEPITGEPARQVFEAWGRLISDGYAGRTVAQALDRIRAV